MAAKFAQRIVSTGSKSGPPAERGNGFQAAQSFRECAPLLRAMARVRTSDAAAADDLVHDTLKEALAQANNHAVTDPIIWLLTIQRRLFAERHNALAVGAVDVIDGPAGDRRTVRAALRNMPDSLREPLFLSDGCGFTCPQVAAILHCSAEVARSLIGRARAELLAVAAPHASSGANC